ncbi:ion transporter [Bacteroidota bacterium]
MDRGHARYKPGRKSRIRHKMHEIIFEADTFWGKFFDVGLLILIVLSILVVMLESVPGISEKYGSLFLTAEWVFTILFTVEYITRIISVGKPVKYITSFMGIVDLLSILPTFLSLFAVGTRSLIVIRSIRLLRIFRIFKLARYISESMTLANAMKASWPKILVFLMAVLTIVIIMGTVMYLVEGAENGFTSIPLSVYWCIVTMTTVGYGDIAPQTVGGQFIASIIMILGYGIIAVPTGIVSAEYIQKKKSDITRQSCPDCSKEDHEADADYCKFCGTKLNP